MGRSKLSYYQLFHISWYLYYLYFIIKGEEDAERIKLIEDAGLEVTYYSRWKEYDIRLKDYEDYKQLREVEKKYIEKAKILAPYFNVSILMDYDFALEYKSSPIEGGKDVFEKILRDRRIV